MGAMQSLWNDADAAACRSDLELRAYTSRLLGRDKTLVLHGGGNTSVKLRITNIVGEDEDILFVKGSGWDLETIQPAGFSPCRMTHLLKLSRLDSMSDAQMAAELKNNMTNAGAPAPSVEAILHALLGPRGTHAIAVRLDPDGLVAEDNESDNAFSRSYSFIDGDPVLRFRPPTSSPSTAAPTGRLH